MTVRGRVETISDAGKIQHYCLSFDGKDPGVTCNANNILDGSKTLIELVHRPDSAVTKHVNINADKIDYWKIGITLAEVDLARASLLSDGVIVSEPKQFLDVGYLCHLNDPDGYSIELLHHRFKPHQQTHPALSASKSKSQPALGQITLRIKDSGPTLQFYQHELGMRLLSRQIIVPHRFILYSLAFTEEQPLSADFDDVNNREWRWQRPYTVLELQHIWGTEHGDFSYRVTPDTGFVQLSLLARDIDEVVAKLRTNGAAVSRTQWFEASLNSNAATVLDPDGYTVRLIEAA